MLVWLACTDRPPAVCVGSLPFLSPPFASSLGQLLSAKVAEKHGVTSRLTELIMASEKQRDAKLNEIMKKMSTDGGAGAGAGSGSAGALS